MIKKVRKNVVFSVLSQISVFLSAAFLLSFHITTLCISSFSFFSSISFAASSGICERSATVYLSGVLSASSIFIIRHPPSIMKSIKSDRNAAVFFINSFPFPGISFLQYVFYAEDKRFIASISKITYTCTRVPFFGIAFILVFISI